ncbi:MAG: hypothetical protein NVS3B16_07560 [Vulcanimicrobiaceae bacterium]
MSFAQERLWFLDHVIAGAGSYNVRKALRLGGPLRLEPLQEAIDALARRHEILRTTFRVVDEQPMQIIADSLHVPLAFVDVSALDEAEREAQAARILRRESGAGFDLSAGPLVRALVVRLASDDHILLLTLHHIVTDEWSGDILQRELIAAYGAFGAGREPEFAELPIQYADFAVWQREWLAGETLERELSYWRRRMEGAPPRVELPLDHPRSSSRHAAPGGVETLVLSRQLTQAVREIGRRHETTTFITLLAAFKVLLFRYTGQTDIVVGSPIANRIRPELEGLIGLFVNTLALRTQVSGEDDFTHVLHDVRDTALEAYDHQDLPFEKLVAELRPERSAGGVPFVNVLMVFRNRDVRAPDLAELRLRPYRLDTPSAKFDLTLNVSDAAGDVTCALQYNADLFERDSMRRMLAHFARLLEGIVATPDRPIAEIPLLSEVERRTMLVEWNDSATDYGAGETLHAAFERQASRTPDAVAAADEQSRLTYRELDGRANELARELCVRGVAHGDFVAVCVERSLDMVVALLAVLKAGAAYLPLDPEYPPERLAYMLADSSARVLITQRRLASRLRKLDVSVTLVEADGPGEGRAGAPLPNVGGPEDVAYLMYTSGSTGRPKGVLVPHRAVTRLVRNTNYVRLEASDVMAQVSSFSFDALTFELWGALLHGARVEIIRRSVTLSPHDFAHAIASKGISVMFLTAALFRQMSREVPSAFAGMRCLIAGGEALDPVSVEAVLKAGPPQHLLNGYGPTETTTFACTYEIVTVRRESIPIGRPIANTEVYVLDAALNPVPIGVAGQLYIGGPGLAFGYLNDPLQTARKFVAHPFRSGEQRLYATGDIVRYLPDGNLDFIGRQDAQVKLRGFRIETGEIETALRGDPAVRDAVVVVRGGDDGEKRLVAYIVDDAVPQRRSDWWRAKLAETLPAYMVPSLFVSLKAIPLTPNGKIDTAALHSPAATCESGLDAYLINPLHYQLIELWERLLDVRPIGIRDDFFALGGHSLLAMRLMLDITRLFGKRISLAAIIDDFTIEHLTEALLHETAADAAGPLVCLQSGGEGTPLIFLHGDLFGGGYYMRSLVRHLDTSQPVYVLPPHGTNARPMPKTVEAMAADYISVVKATVPHGPYVLGGFCFGGLVALEMARQLRALDEVVRDVILIDCSGTNAWLARAGEWSDRLASLLHLGDESRLAMTGGIARLARLVLGCRPRTLAARVRRLRALPPLELRKRAHSRLTRLSRSVLRLAGEPNVVLYWDATGRQYIPRRYPGHVTLLFTGNGAGLSVKGWHGVTDRLQARQLRGDHVRCITRYVDETAARFRECLIAAEKR